MTTVVMAKALRAWMSDLSTLCSTEVLPDILPLEIGPHQSYRLNLKVPLNEETPFFVEGVSKSKTIYLTPSKSITKTRVLPDRRCPAPAGP
jgi:hypothetical protein